MVTYKENPVLNIDGKDWKEIPETEGLYYIARCGSVYSTLTNKYRKLNQKTWYKTVDMYVKGRVLHRSIHRLLAILFIPNPLNKPEVNHIDGNKLNNDLSNLEWVTSSENTLHSFRIGLQKPTKPQLGKKIGKTSKYRYVMRDRKRWKANLKHDGKLVCARNFSNEVAAAHWANEMIDFYQLDKPKNTFN